MNQSQQQTHALAGIMQAVCQIEDIANRGETDPAATRASIASVLQQDPDQLTDAIGSLDSLRYGLQRMQEMLQGEQNYLPALQYAMAVMQMEKNLRRSSSVQQAVARELQLINLSGVGGRAGDPDEQQQSEADMEPGGAPAQELITQLADVWTSQVRRLEPQVVVHGKPVYLQNETNIQLIRALLLAALRCAWLWHQLGGRRWHLLLRRKRLLQQVRELLKNL
ncbi:MAG: DUF489 family protein [Gammaproteobacteria bacterium]|nr:DUF489 family protein [Gammaproteobacteria bacterium]